MSMESIISQLEKSKAKKPDAISEDYFTRIAYILENSSNRNFTEDFANMKNTGAEELLIKYNLLNNMSPVKRNPKKI